jgi:hypothetical protein
MQALKELPVTLELKRCPWCGTARPFIYGVWASEGGTPRSDGEDKKAWGAFLCSTCGSLISAAAHRNSTDLRYIDETFPKTKSAHEDLPDRARTYLEQAYETLSSPDAAAVMAGSAVDSMLKELGYEKGSVYTRIDEALADRKLTEGMAQWAHSVRLGANRPRHSDADNPHVSPLEARQSVDFAEALGNFLFVLTARIQRGIAAAAPAQ